MKNNDITPNELFNDDNLIDEEINQDEIINFEDSKIFTEQGDLEIDGLYRKSKIRKTLELQPDFQRKFVWDEIKSSKLIESALIDIPLPMIYLAEEEEKTIVIDGQQRLTTFFNFIDDKFRLRGLDTLTNISGSKNGKSKGSLFSELPEKYRNKILDTKIRTITFKKECKEDLKFNVFERLNTGAVSLNAQELRNCVYRGKYNDLLKKLASNPNFMELINISEPHSRMDDVQLVLRFASHLHRRYKGFLKNFLNEDMQLYKNISDSDAIELTEQFKKSISVSNSLFGKNAFKKYQNIDDYNGNWKSFNVTLYELLMVSFIPYDKNQIYRHLDEIREGWLDLISDDGFIEYISYSTGVESRLKLRFEVWGEMLSNIFSNDKKQVRCFSYQLKKELYDNDSTCTICGNNITHIDDSAVDHIEQYWVGGKTIPSNARLTHRFCNNNRPRKEFKKTS